MTDVAETIADLGPWYHTIDLGNGVTTPGRSQVAAKFASLEEQLPDDLRGLRILDLGCNAGGIAVQLAQRGANVVGVETGVNYYRQACWVRDVLGLDIEYHNSTVYEIGELDGTFDVVMFLGLIYHLRYPQLALDVIATKCNGILVMNTPIIQSSDRVMEMRLRGEPGRIVQSAESNYNWWFPSPPALEAMLVAAGFTEVTRFGGRDEPFVSSSPNENNASAFATGTVQYRAECAAVGTLPVPMR